MAMRRQLAILEFLIKDRALKLSSLKPFLDAARCPEISKEYPLRKLTTHEAARLIRKLAEE